MTATTLDHLDDRPELLRRIPLGPAEGWLAFAAAAALPVVFAAAVADAGWLPSDSGGSGYLTWLALAGFLFSTLLAKLGWGRRRTYGLGALVGGLVILLITGGIILGQGAGFDPGSLVDRLFATYRVVRHAWQDLVVEGLPFTSESAHYHLVLGGVVWGGGLLAGYAVFGHRRPIDAIVALGFALLVNMALTLHQQLYLLVIYSCAALLLLMRSHVFEEEVTWLRRRIGDPAAIGELYLRGGATFVGVAVAGSLLLTATASSAPLQGLWLDIPSRLSAASDWLQKFAPPNGDIRGFGVVGFGDQATTSGLWSPSDQVAFEARFASPDLPQFKWRAGVYATYTNIGWSSGHTRDVQAGSGDILLNGLAGQATSAGRELVRFQVTPEAFRDPTILSPAMIQFVDEPVTAKVLGSDGWFATVEASGSGSYSVSAMVPTYADVPGGITQARLRAAGTAYPPEVVSIYTALPDGAMGPAAHALLDTIRQQVVVPPGADPSNAYDLARTMETYLRDPAHFTYSTDVRAQLRQSCDGLSTVECFARIRAGYCEYYASTMAVLLRASGVPARVAYGFLPGQRAPDGVETVNAVEAHWWVEVYFPGTGWVEFDPTGGGVGQPEPIPSGSVNLPSAPAATVAPTFSGAPGSSSGPVTPPGGGASAGAGPFIAIGLILLVAMAVLIAVTVRRGPRRPMHPDQAWGSVGRWAARLGIGPRPSQTVYEYAGALADELPASRIELTTIARAKVEVAYGRRALEPDRLRTIARAYQRLRLALVSFAVRRFLSRARPRR
jgi:transglutaminase-like putative cysteine protease